MQFFQNQLGWFLATQMFWSIYAIPSTFEFRHSNCKSKFTDANTNKNRYLQGWMSNWKTFSMRINRNEIKKICLQSFELKCTVYQVILCIIPPPPQVLVPYIIHLYIIWNGIKIMFYGCSYKHLYLHLALRVTHNS